MTIVDTLKELGFKDLSYLMNPGIYVLFLNEEVVYVGQTISIFKRLSDSDHRGRAYDKAYFIKCELSELDRLEALMILRLKPQIGKAYKFNDSVKNPRNRPDQAKESTLTINIRGTELSIPLRRRF